MTLPQPLMGALSPPDPGPAVTLHPALAQPLAAELLSVQMYGKTQKGEDTLILVTLKIACQSCNWAAK